MLIFYLKSFRLMSDDLHAKGHRIILTQVQPHVLRTIIAVKPKHIEVQGSDFNIREGTSQYITTLFKNYFQNKTIFQNWIPLTIRESAHRPKS